MTFEKVAKILADYKETDVAEIHLESTFEQLGFDSLDMVELVMSFEEEFGIAIEMDGSLKTVADVVNLIEKGE